MLVERVDVVGAVVAQAVVGDLADVLGEMSKPYSCVHPNFVAITWVPETPARLSRRSSVRERGFAR
jgi:rRNA processing protein Gar1